MKQIIGQYGKFLLEGMILVILLMLLFVGIRDDAGNQGVPHIVGARLPTGGINYEGYSDFEAYHAESGKTAPKIEFSGGGFETGTVRLSDYIHAVDHAGHDLQIKVVEIIHPDGSDITGTLQPDTEISLDNPGIYSVKVCALDDGGRKTVCTLDIPVNKT
ncbi:MAG: hypothetical protein HDQ95_16265 [Roseburia sp.]|nr:hypothetical protein [Roseburia sp.]